MKVGDSVEVLLGANWFAAEVVQEFSWSHHSGRCFDSYKVRFPNGAEICCGNNSIRRPEGECYKTFDCNAGDHADCCPAKENQ
jgi:hypothetical protein